MLASSTWKSSLARLFLNLSTQCPLLTDQHKAQHYPIGQSALFAPCPSPLAKWSSLTIRSPTLNFLLAVAFLHIHQCFHSSKNASPCRHQRRPAQRSTSLNCHLRGRNIMSLEHPPPGVDLDADQGDRIISSMIALIILPTIFVILRLSSRKISRAGFWVSWPACVPEVQVRANWSSGTMYLS